MQGIARGTYESGGKVPGEHRGMQGIQGNARGTYGSGCKVPGKCWGMHGNARGTYGSGYKLPGNAGIAGECQGNVWEWVYSTRGMQGTTREMEGSGCKVLAE